MKLVVVVVVEVSQNCGPMPLGTVHFLQVSWQRLCECSYSVHQLGYLAINALQLVNVTQMGEVAVTVSAHRVGVEPASHSPDTEQVDAQSAQCKPTPKGGSIPPRAWPDCATVLPLGLYLHTKINVSFMSNGVVVVVIVVSLLVSFSPGTIGASLQTAAPQPILLDRAQTICV